MNASTILKRLAFTLIFAAVALPTTARVNNEDVSPKVLADLLIAAQQQAGFNGTLLVAKDGKVLFEQSIGYVDATNKTGVLTPAHAFSPGSITKEFSVLALLQLEQQEVVKFNQTVSAFLPSLPAWANKITIEHLLTHTSGLPDIRYRSNMTTDEAMADLKQIDKLKFEPGQGYAYGNNNTLLRTLIVEKVSGKSFDQYLQENVFLPMGLQHTSANENLKVKGKKIAAGAKPLSLKGITAFTTVRDLFLLEQALWFNPSTSSNFIKKAITQTSNAERGRAHYDFGFYQRHANGDLVFIEHDGTYPSHYALKRSNLALSYTIILLSNDGRKDTLNELRTTLVNYLEQGVIKLPQIWQLIHDINTKDINSALSTYREDIERGEIDADEEQLNYLGYHFLNKKEVNNAAAILALNWKLHSDSLNAADSYVEVLIEQRELTLANQIATKALKDATSKEHQYYRQRFEHFVEQINQLTQK